MSSWNSVTPCQQHQPKCLISRDNATIIQGHDILSGDKYLKYFLGKHKTCSCLFVFNPTFPALHCIYLLVPINLNQLIP
jgi:hypothetical protein